MNKIKRILASILALTMVGAAMAGCSGDNSSTNSSTSSTSSTSSETSSTTPAPSGETITLKVWGPQEEQANLAAMVDEFKAANPDKTYDISFGVVAEGDAETKYNEDPAAAADVFMFENGQTNKLVANGCLYEVTKNKEDITARNVPGSVEAASVGESLYAYPMTADNGYFMYYDKSVFSEEDIKSLDQMLKVANEKGKKVFMDVSNGWYIASFFLGAGCTMSLDENGNQILDFNNDNGVAAGEAIKAFCADPAFMTGDDAILTGGMGTSIAMGISGTWNAEAISGLLGENYGAAALPTFTVNGEQKQMASFGGYKLIGVNSLTKFPIDAMELADFLTNEANQQKRFETRQLGPSNANVANSEAVKANVALAALAAQSQYALPQNNVTDTFWAPAEAFGNAMETKDYSASVKEQLDAMVAQIEAAQ